MSGFTPSGTITIGTSALPANAAQETGNLSQLNAKFDTQITLADGYTNPDATFMGAFTIGFNGSTWDRVKVGQSGTITTLTGVLSANPLIQYNSTRPTLTTGQITNAQSNTRGDLTVSEQFAPQYEDNTNAVALTILRPLAVNTYALSSSDSISAASAVVKASPGTLYKIFGYNGNAGIRFIQIYNTTSVPADTAVPVISLQVAATSAFNLDLTSYGKYFSTGICIANSSTAATKTIGAADSIFNVLYF